MARFNLLKEIDDPFGSSYFRKLDDLDTKSVELLNPKRIDLINTGDRLETNIYINRIIDSLYVTSFISTANKNDAVEAEIAAGDR